MSALNLFRKVKETSDNDVEDRLRRVESDLRSLKLEWAETYDKVHHALDRIGKRWQRIVVEKGADSGTDHPQNPENLSPERLWQLARERGMLR